MVGETHEVIDQAHQAQSLAHLDEAQISQAFRIKVDQHGAVDSLLFGDVCQFIEPYRLEPSLDVLLGPVRHGRDGVEEIDRRARHVSIGMV